MKQRKAVKDMKENEEMNGMTNEQFKTALKQILLYAKKAEDKKEIIEYLEKLIEDDKKA